MNAILRKFNLIFLDILVSIKTGHSYSFFYIEKCFREDTEIKSQGQKM